MTDDVSLINVSMLEGYKTNFDAEATKFEFSVVSEFRASYLNTCSDSYVKQMGAKLSPKYDKINVGYKVISEWWKEYNDNARALESTFASDSGSTGAISDTATRSFVASHLTTLQTYNPDFTDTFTATSVDTTSEIVSNAGEEIAEVIHKVVAGDTLWAIAKKYLGDGRRYPELAEYNGLANPNLILVGQQIRIPGMVAADEVPLSSNISSPLTPGITEEVLGSLDMGSGAPAVCSCTCHVPTIVENGLINDGVDEIVSSDPDTVTSGGETSAVPDIAEEQNIQQDVETITESTVTAGATGVAQADAGYVTGSVVGGAVTGAAVGAAVGSFIPIIGTGVGAVIGGIVGGVIGFFTGSKVSAAEAAHNAGATAVEGEVKKSGGFLAGLVNSVVGGAKAIGNFVVRTGATVVNAASALVKGVLNVAEDIVDLAAYVVGGVASIFTGIWDLGQAIHGAVTGKEWESVTKKMWGDGILKFTETKWINKAWDAMYATEAGKALDNASWSWMRSDSLGFKITEGIGYVAGYVALVIFTGGIGAAGKGGAVVKGGTALVKSGATGAKAIGAGKSIWAGFNATKATSLTLKSGRTLFSISGSFAKGGKVFNLTRQAIVGGKAIGIKLGTKGFIFGTQKLAAIGTKALIVSGSKATSIFGKAKAFGASAVKSAKAWGSSAINSAKSFGGTIASKFSSIFKATKAAQTATTAATKAKMASNFFSTLKKVGRVINTPPRWVAKILPKKLKFIPYVAYYGTPTVVAGSGQFVQWVDSEGMDIDNPDSWNMQPLEFD